MARYFRLVHDHFDAPTVNNGEMITEQSGFRSTKQIVSEFMRSGRMLEAYRNGQYDTEGEGDDVEMDPTRDPSFDLEDASLIMKKAGQAYERVSKIRQKDKEVSNGNKPKDITHDKKSEEVEGKDDEKTSGEK